MKGLNKTEGTNRFKFEKKAARVQQVNVDVVHQTRLPDTLDTSHATPDSGSKGCHFQDELENRKNLDTSGEFCRLVKVTLHLNTYLMRMLDLLPLLLAAVLTDPLLCDLINFE